ncbi:MAG: hypothetical protein ACRD20_20375 [Terriglobales bacterium]
MKIAELQEQEGIAPQTPMPSYVSHKRVWALKIEKVHADEDGQGIALQFEGNHFALRAFTTSQLEHKPVPEPGMYFVQYEGGYFSFSPAETFEKGYTSDAEAPVIGKITLAIGKPVLTPWGELKTVRVTQETKWGGILGEIHLTGVQAHSLAKEIQSRV